MDFKISEFALAIVGLFLLVFGACVLFSDKFLTKMRLSLWKKTETDASFPLVFSEAESLSFDRYGRGLGAFVAGLILLALLVLKHLK
jgi:hypothetical protein